MTDPPSFQSRPLLGELFAASQAARSDERILRTADKVLESSYSAATQRQRWQYQQEHPGVQYAPRSPQHPGVPQYAPGVKAFYAAGTLSRRAAVGGAIAGLGSAPFMPGKAVGGSYNGAPVTKTNRYFEKANTFVQTVSWTLLISGPMIGAAISTLGNDDGTGAQGRHTLLLLGIAVGGFISLCGFMFWYLACRTNRKEAQIVGGLFMLLLAAIGWKLSRMSESPTGPSPDNTMRNPDGSWNPIGNAPAHSNYTRGH